MKIKKFHVYFLQSFKNYSYYIGVTNNISKRLEQHNKGESKSTASKRPWKLKRIEEYSNINSAYKREKFLKKMKSRKIIEKIINSGKD